MCDLPQRTTTSMPSCNSAMSDQRVHDYRMNKVHGHYTRHFMKLGVISAYLLPQLSHYMLSLMLIQEMVRLLGPSTQSVHLSRPCADPIGRRRQRPRLARNVEAAPVGHLAPARGDARAPSARPPGATQGARARDNRFNADKLQATCMAWRGTPLLGAGGRSDLTRTDKPISRHGA